MGYSEIKLPPVPVSERFVKIGNEYIWCCVHTKIFLNELSNPYNKPWLDVIAHDAIAIWMAASEIAFKKEDDNAVERCLDAALEWAKACDDKMLIEYFEDVDNG